MLRRIASTAICLLYVSGLCRAAELKLPLLWSINTQTLLETAPTLADINGDGYCEVLLAGREEMIALDGRGRQLWRWQTAGRYMTYPAVCLRKGQPALIYAADTSGLLTCLDGQGKVVWQAKLSAGSSWSAAVVCDLNHDGTWQVIQTDDKGTIWAFDAPTGKVLWQAHTKGAPVSPAVGDLDATDKDEIVVASNAGQLAVFSSTGGLWWRRKVSCATESWATSAPVIFAASDGRRRIAVGNADGDVKCFDAAGKLLWSRRTRGGVASSLSVGDMDHDGRADLFAITQTGWIYRFDEDGRVLWSIDTQGRTLAAGGLIDLENNGHLDFVASTQSGHLMIFNDRGAIVFEHQFPHRTINQTPAFGDVTAASPGMEMVLSGGESGLVYCFGTPAAVDARPSSRPWISYRGDSRKSGAWLALAKPEGATMTASDASWRLLAGEAVVFRVRVPDARERQLPLKAWAACQRPDGSRQSAMTLVYGQQGSLSLPVDVVRPGNYRFTWQVADATGKRQAEGKHEVFLEPFANERALVERTLRTLNSVADRVAATLPLAASGLRQKAAELEHEARRLQSIFVAAGGADAAVEQSALHQAAALTRMARRAAGLASAVDAASALGAGTSLVAFETTLWESGGIDAQRPARAVNPLKIARRVVLGEHDPASLKLMNVTDREIQVRVVADKAPGDPAVVPFRSVAVPTSQGGLAWDPLVRLDESSVIGIPPFSTREVWLDTRFDQVNPGKHVVRVRFQALNGSGVLEDSGSPRDVPAPETVVEIQYRVFPFAMGPAGACRLCCWASLGPAEIADLLDHGNNVFCVPPGDPKYDASGRLAGVDYTKMDTILRALRGHDVVVLVQGTLGLRGTSGSPQYARDVKAALADLVNHMASMGLDRDHFALYPFDEPGGAGWKAVNALAEFGRQVKAADPRVKIYLDGGGELPMFQKLAPCIDIWCPALSMLPEQSPEMKLIRGTRKELWSYECGYGYTCAMRANLKDTNIVAEYRTAALRALRWGATGIGFWCYNIGPDAWQRTANDYPLVYPGRTGPVTSRRWEAVRQGIEDFRILAALRQSQAKIKDPALKRRIAKLFDSRLPALTDRSYQEVLAGLGRWAFAESQNDATLAAFRREMLDCVEAVCREKSKPNL